eukprot:jgi/Undpi1/13989/HiC_scaffold_9.g03640.m1
MGLRKTRRRLLKPWPFLEKAACSLSLLVVALSDGNYSCCRGAAAAGLGQGVLSPLAQLTVINAQVERDDMYYFQVLTEAWQSTRVRVAIEDCTPRTAVIASFGAEPTPSRHELLAHVSLDRNGNETCGVDVITRPSYSRDGVWHFAVVGGSPLHGERYFAGPPDNLAFEASVIAEERERVGGGEGASLWPCTARQGAHLPSLFSVGACDRNWLPLPPPLPLPLPFLPADASRGGGGDDGEYSGVQPAFASFISFGGGGGGGVGHLLNLSLSYARVDFSTSCGGENVVYPTLDRGNAAPGDCVRRIAIPPAVVPTITGPPGSSLKHGGGGGGGGAGAANFLPTMGRFLGGSASDRSGENGGDDDNAPPNHSIPPSWLGAFTVSPYDEIITVPFQLSALVDAEEATSAGGNAIQGVGGGGGRYNGGEAGEGGAKGKGGVQTRRVQENVEMLGDVGGRGGGRYGGIKHRRAMENIEIVGEGGGGGGRGGGGGSSEVKPGTALQNMEVVEGKEKLERRGPQHDRRQRQRQQRQRSLNLSSEDRTPGNDGGRARERAGVGGGGGVGVAGDRRLGADKGGDGCKVTVCAAPARIPSGLEEEEGEGKGKEGRGGGQQEGRSVCHSVTVEGNGAAVGGVLELPDRPQTGRWYLSAHSACGDASPHRSRRRLENEILALETDGLDLEASEPEEKGERRVVAAAGGGEGGGGGRGEGGAGAGAGGGGGGGGGRRGSGGEKVNIFGSDSGWGLEVLSLQRDWAHVEWSAEMLVPNVNGAGGSGGDGGDGEEKTAAATDAVEACLPGGAGKEMFVIRAAAFAEACPRGAVDVSGVDLVQQTVSNKGGGKGRDEKEGEVRRFSCVGAELPMVMRKEGSAKVFGGKGAREEQGAMGEKEEEEEEEGKGRGGGGNGERAIATIGVERRVLVPEGGRGGGDDEGKSAEWRWRGPSPPSLWYTLEMSGREVGASMEVRLSVNSSAPLSSGSYPSSLSLGSPSPWHMGPGSLTPPPSSPALPLNMSVAMRVGALPVVDANGVAREGTWVLWTADALSEPAEWSQSGDEGVGRGKTSGLRGKKTRLENEAVKGYDANGYDANGYDANGYDANGVHVEILPTWGTTFTWNVSHPPPLHPAAVWGGAGLGKGTAATTLFMVVSGETVVEAAAREAAYGGGGGGGVKEGGMRRELDGGGEGGEGGGGVRELWTLGVAPEVTFRYCTEDICPASRGVCRAARGGSGDDYVTVSKCHCYYGYGGEACAQRVVSYVALLFQFCLLVLSNLAVVPGVRLALRLGAATGAAPAVVLALTGAASAAYHVCDLEKP